MSAIAVDDLGCVETFESVIARMTAADRALAAELGITFDEEATPGTLVEMAKRSAFAETEVAGEWFAAFAAWLDWMKFPEDELDQRIRAQLKLRGYE